MKNSHKIMIATQKFLLHFKGDVPDLEDVLPLGYKEYSKYKMVAGQEFTYMDMMLRVEAVCEGYKGYAISNVHGDDVKWYSRDRLEAMFDKNGVKMHRITV